VGRRIRGAGKGRRRGGSRDSLVAADKAAGLETESDEDSMERAIKLRATSQKIPMVGIPGQTVQRVKKGGRKKSAGNCTFPSLKRKKKWPVIYKSTEAGSEKYTYFSRM